MAGRDDDDEDRPRNAARPARRVRDERDDDDDEDRPRRRKKNPVNTRVPCPECGAKSVRKGPWPWYLGTVGAILCKAVICNECGHQYDEKKPHANLASRKRNLAIVINGIGLVGIIAVVVLLALWINYSMNPR